MSNYYHTLVHVTQNARNIDLTMKYLVPSLILQLNCLWCGSHSFHSQRFPHGLV